MISQKTISLMICEILNIEYIDFSKPENFVKLLDLIFKYKKVFNLTMRKRVHNFIEDTLNILYEELQEAKIETPLQVKEFSCIIKNEYWSEDAAV